MLDHGHIFMIHLLFEPFVAAVHLALMSLLVGASIFLGFAIMVLIIILQLVFARCLRRLRTKLSPLMARRLQMVTDILAGIRTIKCQCWEAHLCGKV